MAKSLRNIFTSKNEPRDSLDSLFSGVKRITEGIANLFRSEKVNSFKLEGGTYVKEYTDKSTGEFRQEFYFKNEFGEKELYQTFHAETNLDNTITTLSTKIDNGVPVSYETNQYKDIKAASKYEVDKTAVTNYEKDGITLRSREEKIFEQKESWDGKKFTLETINRYNKDDKIISKVEYKQDDKFMARKELVSTFEYTYKPVESVTEYNYDKQDSIMIETKYNKDKTVMTNIEFDSKRNEIKTTVTEKTPDGLTKEKIYRHGNLLEEKTIDTDKNLIIIKSIEKGNIIKEKIVFNDQTYKIERNSDGQLSKIETDKEIKTRTYENGQIIETIIDKRLEDKMTIIQKYPAAEKVLDKPIEKQFSLPYENLTREVHVHNSDKYTVFEYGKTVFHETEKTYDAKTNELLKEEISIPSELRVGEFTTIIKTYDKGELKSESLTIEKNNGDVIKEYKEFENGEIVKEQKYDSRDTQEFKIEDPKNEKPEKEESIDKKDSFDTEDWFSDI